MKEFLLETDTIEAKHKPNVYAELKDPVYIKLPNEPLCRLKENNLVSNRHLNVETKNL